MRVSFSCLLSRRGISNVANKAGMVEGMVALLVLYGFLSWVLNLRRGDEWEYSITLRMEEKHLVQEAEDLGDQIKIFDYHKGVKPGTHHPKPTGYVVP